MRIFVWNIHGAEGYKNYRIPKFVSEEIIDQEADIVLLTEFVMLFGWDYFRMALEKKYNLFCTPFISGKNKDGVDFVQNGVLIAIKNSPEFNFESAKVYSDMNTTQTEEPNFLRVDIKCKEKLLTIIGTRIRDTDHDPQFKALTQYLKSISSENKIICAGDFNEWTNPIRRKLGGDLKVFTPRFKMKSGNFDTLDTWSAVLKNESGKIGKALIDHIITKGIEMDKVKYNWNFVNKKNGYGDIEPRDYKSDMISYPDHAIITAEFDMY